MNFDAAWRAFEQDDARIKAPAVLEGRVLHMLRASRVERSRRRMVFAKPSLCATAAALLLGMLVRRPDDAPPLRNLASRPLASDTAPAALKPEARRDRPVIPARNPRPSTAVRAATTVTITQAFPEALQVVRLRVPREALEPLGLVLFEPGAQGIVDVDLLVGEDGLPRDIRSVRTVQE